MPPFGLVLRAILGTPNMLLLDRTSQDPPRRSDESRPDAARATARSFGHVLHQLWLEVTGVVFIFMAGS